MYFNNMSKPFIKWAGGKTYLLRYINGLINGKVLPQRYCEPMIGGGAVYFDLRDRFNEHIISDMNVDLINLYRVIRDSVDELIDELQSDKYKYVHKSDNNSKTNYLSIRASAPCTDITKAARILFLLKTCFNGLMRVNKSGRFNVPMGSYKNPKIVDRDVLKEASTALDGTDIRLSDVQSTISSLTGDYFLFLDPPYHGEQKFTSYSGIFDDTCQQALINTLAASNHKFIYTNRATEFILNALTIHGIKFDTIPLKHSIQPKYTTGAVDREVVAYRL